MSGKSILLLSILGNLVSFYAIDVEEKVLNPEIEFKPMCDISETMSCSKVQHDREKVQCD